MYLYLDRLRLWLKGKRGGYRDAALPRL